MHRLCSARGVWMKWNFRWGAAHVCAASMIGGASLTASCRDYGSSEAPGPPSAGGAANGWTEGAGGVLVGGHSAQGGYHAQDSDSTGAAAAGGESSEDASSGQNGSTPVTQAGAGGTEEPGSGGTDGGVRASEAGASTRGDAGDAGDAGNAGDAGDAGDAGAGATAVKPTPFGIVGPAWEFGIVTLCWESATLQRTDFAERSRDVVSGANAWAEIAQIELSGWDRCPDDPRGMVRLSLVDGTRAGSMGVGQAEVGYEVVLGVERADFALGLIPHVFGHILGIAPEVNDHIDDLGSGCLGPGIDTPAVRSSIMKSLTPCQYTRELSLSDVIEAQRLYGARTELVSPLVVAWNPHVGDSVTVTATSGLELLAASEYTAIFAEAWMFNVQLPGTVPLKLFWSDERLDAFTFVTPESETNALDAGYSYVRTEGYVYPLVNSHGALPPPPGARALNLLWNGGRQDNVLVGSQEADSAFKTRGYTFSWTEAYGFHEAPYAVLYSRRRESVPCPLATTRRSALPGSTLREYDSPRMEAGVFRFQLPGTVPLVNYRDTDTGSYSLLRSTSPHVRPSHVAMSTEGFVYESPQPGTAPFVSHLEPGGDGVCTTLSTNAELQAAGYTVVGTEGWGVALKP